MRSATTPESVALTYDEIIFQTRNRAYGAFDLRRQYKPTLTRALAVGVGFFLLGLSAPTLYNRLFPTDPLTDGQVMIETTFTHPPEAPTEPLVPLPPVEQAPAVNTVRNLPLVVIPEAEVIEDVLPPTADDLQNATSGPVTAEGTGVDEVIAPPEASAPTVEERAVEVAPKPDEPFLTVEQQPQFPGGTEALRSYLSNNLRYPRAAASTGVSGRVFVSFVVNTDGSLTDVQIVKGIGFGCDEEAVRVIQKMPHWRPGKQSGRPVRVKYNLPIVFALE